MVSTIDVNYPKVIHTCNNNMVGVESGVSLFTGLVCMIQVLYFGPHIMGHRGTWLRGHCQL